MSLCFLFPSVVIVGFLRSVLFGFGVVVEAENPRGIRCFVFIGSGCPGGGPACDL